MIDDGPIWMIGCGNMGGAMLRRWIGAGVDPTRVTVVTRSEATVPVGVRALRVLPTDATPATLVLALKPQQLHAIVPVLAHVRPAMLMSILAGVDVATLDRSIPAGAVVRAMPNLPVAIGKGVTALFTTSGDPSVRSAAEALAAPLGHHEWIADEMQFDAVTALAGCGPGFVFRFADAMATAGEALGLSGPQALRLALATLEGAAIMAADAGVSPATLADRVASPGGSTREGLNVLDRDDALKSLMANTLAASAARNRMMGDAARAGD